MLFNLFLLVYLMVSLLLLLKQVMYNSLLIYTSIMFCTLQISKSTLSMFLYYINLYLAQFSFHLQMCCKGSQNPADDWFGWILWWPSRIANPITHLMFLSVNMFFLCLVLVVNPSINLGSLRIFILVLLFLYQLYVSLSHAAAKFDLFHTNIWGPIYIPSIHGHQYFLTIVYDHNRLFGFYC